MVGFYSHRKTARLRARIGDDALWLLPRLWAYCAENQPDGDLSAYDTQELALLIGYKGDATSMLQALKDCRWIDLDGKVHDWEEHNGYHKKFSIRAKNAAEARWKNARSNASSNANDTQIPPHAPLNTDMEKERGKEDCHKQCLEHQPENGNGREDIRPPASRPASSELSASERITREKELKRVEATLDKLFQRASDFGLTQDEKMRRASLKERRQEILDLLGMKA